jgi:hypothetical protein
MVQAEQVVRVDLLAPQDHMVRPVHQVLLVAREMLGAVELQEPVVLTEQLDQAVRLVVRDLMAHRVPADQAGQLLLLALLHLLLVHRSTLRHPANLAHRLRQHLLEILELPSWLF